MQQLLIDLAGLAVQKAPPAPVRYRSPEFLPHVNQHPHADRVGLAGENADLS
jgi:hypothetical protein